MKLKMVTALLMGMIAAPYAVADDVTFDLSLTADDGSRWYEHGSEAYAELGKDRTVLDDGFPIVVDGFYHTVTDAELGGGALVFPSQGDFLSIGTLSFDSVTGAVTGLVMDFDDYIADDDSVANVGYETTISSVSGVVGLTGGEVSSIDLTSEITFTYETVFGAFDYEGSFSIAGDRFDLMVDGTNSIPVIGEARYVWDVEGGVSNLAPVPEPATYAMFFAGIAMLGGIVRRRRRS